MDTLGTSACTSRTHCTCCREVDQKILPKEHENTRFPVALFHRQEAAPQPEHCVIWRSSHVSWEEPSWGTAVAEASVLPMSFLILGFCLHLLTRCDRPAYRKAITPPLHTLHP